MSDQSRIASSLSPPAWTKKLQASRSFPTTDGDRAIFQSVVHKLRASESEEIVFEGDSFDALYDCFPNISDVIAKMIQGISEGEDPLSLSLDEVDVLIDELDVTSDDRVIRAFKAMCDAGIWLSVESSSTAKRSAKKKKEQYVRYINSIDLNKNEQQIVLKCSPEFAAMARAEEAAGSAGTD